VWYGRAHTVMGHNAQTFLARKSTNQEPCMRGKYRMKDSNKMNDKGALYSLVFWLHLAFDGVRLLVIAGIELNHKAWGFFTWHATIIFSRRTFFFTHGIKAEGKTCNSPLRPVRLWHVDAVTFSSQSINRWRWGCRSYVPSVLYSQEDPRY
jgi:hypothetical protein